MASSISKVVAVCLILGLIVPSTMATNYVVNWSLGLDVQGWLSSKTFHVSDTLHFDFTSPTTVAVVDQTGFINCDASQAQINDVSGSFTYSFTQSGTVSFISAGPGDCAAGLKMPVLVKNHL